MAAPRDYAATQFISERIWSKHQDIFELLNFFFKFFFCNPQILIEVFLGICLLKQLKENTDILRPVQKIWEQEKPVGNLTGIKPKHALDTYCIHSSYTQMVQMVHGYYEGYL